MQAINSSPARTLPDPLSKLPEVGRDGREQRVAPLDDAQRALKAETNELAGVSFGAKAASDRGERPGLMTMMRCAIDLFKNSHDDAGSKLESLRLKFDVFRALAFGDTRALAKGWDEVIVQTSDHHPGVIEVIRARGVFGEPRSSFVMIGLPAQDLVLFREGLSVLRQKFPPPPVEDVQK